jgi:replicative DNA helicase
MADNEHRIISKVMTDKDIQPVLDRGVDGSWFYNTEHRTAMTFILGHHDKYGVVPARATLASHMGMAYKILAVAESLEYLLDTQATYCRWMHAKATAEDAGDALEANLTDEAVEALEKGLAKIHTFTPHASRLVDSMDNDRVADRWEDYKRREAGGTIIGFTTGFPTIDETTLGLQAGHLVTVVAPPKAGKTSLCLTMANHIYVTHKVPVLFVSFEMGIRELELRQESLLAGINFRDLQSGDLDPTDRAKYEDLLDLIEDDYTWPFHFMDAASGSTVSAMQAQIERVDPGVVFLDGIYMMTDEVTGDTNTAQALTNITRSLKRVAVQTKKPVVINTQALEWKMKGTKLNLNSTGYSSSFAQDSDVVLGMERVKPDKGEDEETHAFSRYLRVLASRNSGTASVELIFDYTSGTISEI